MPRRTPHSHEPSVRCAPVLVALAPEEFGPSFRELVALHGDDLSDEVVLTAFGDFVAGLLRRHPLPEESVDRCCDALETTLRLRAGAAALVVENLLPALSPALVERLRPFADPLLSEAIDVAQSP